MIQLANLSGSKAFKWQRISAIYLFLYTPLLAIYISLLPEYNSLANIINNLFDPKCFFGYLSLVAFVLVILHSWIGGRDILIDYLPRNRLTFGLNVYFAVLILCASNLIIMTVSLSRHI